MIEAYKKEILGFRITSTRIEAAYKLSQNRNKEDHKRILADLEKDENNRSIVEAMKNTFDK
jgi:transcriptional regulator